MKNIICLVQKIYTHLKNWEGVALLLTRLCIGTIFVQTGFGKLMHFDQTVAFFSELGIPFPMINAAMAASVECVGGALLIVGLMTRVVSVKLSVVMIVAILTAQLSEVSSISDLIRLQEVDYLLFFALFIFGGAGKLSLDQWIKTRFFRKTR